MPDSLEYVIHLASSEDSAVISAKLINLFGDNKNITRKVIHFRLFSVISQSEKIPFLLSVNVDRENDGLNSTATEY